MISTVTSAAVPSSMNSTYGGTSGAGSQELGKDDFLKLLVTQLKNQDPTKPLEDREFISQMAQFSSLEQMTNVRQGLDVLTQMQLTTQALGLVGRTVDINNPGSKEPITGKVDQVKFVSGEPRLIVGGKEYSLPDVLAVH